VEKAPSTQKIGGHARQLKVIGYSLAFDKKMRRHDK